MILFDGAHLFIWRALGAGLAVALMVGPLGSFVLWRRMAYFGDSLAHSGLLGVVLGVMLGLQPTLGVMVVSILFAALLTLLETQKNLATDTLLGVLSHSALAGGLIAMGLVRWPASDLNSFLFGDILAVGADDLWWMGGMILIVGLVLPILWRPLLLLSLHEDMARAEGVPALRIRLSFMLLMAGFVAVSIKIVGVLLITALLIIPAAAARQAARTPEAMAAIATVLAAIAVLLGLEFSFQIDVPSGPAIVLTALCLFLLMLVAKVALRR